MDLLLTQINIGTCTFLKAFDTLDHVILCNKLSEMRVESIKLKSYLTDRGQLVKINKVSSKSTKVICGVPIEI